MAQIGVDKGEYVFDASLKTITFTGVTVDTIDQVKLVNNVVNGIIIFNPIDPTKLGGLLNNVLTLDFDTTGMSDTDDLFICVNFETIENESLALLSRYKTQIGVDTGEWVFDAAAQTITITGPILHRVEQIGPILNGATGETIFNPERGILGTLLNNVLTLDYDTTSQNNNDELYIFVNGVINNNLRGSNIQESFFLESNSSLLWSPFDYKKVEVIIYNAGFRNFSIRYKSPALYGQFITLAPGERFEEEHFDGDIFGIWEYNPAGDATSELVFITEVAAVSLSNLYLVLKNETVTNPTFPPLTTGTSVTPGVYSTAAAVTPSGTITLNGLGQANPVFIFIITGALTVSANTTFILSNGATANNIFWVCDGAVSLGAKSDSFGTFISLVANSTGNNSTLTGRVLSLGGAVANSGSPIIVPSTGSQYDLGYVERFALFTSAGALSNSGANNITGDAGTNLGAITGFNNVTFTDGALYNNTSQVEITMVGGGVRIVEIKI
tara:strand:+ start:5895 stop:7388 length:1494 start_codon:yes stop_codon:yes gene_type:complete